MWHIDAFKYALIGHSIFFFIVVVVAVQHTKSQWQFIWPIENKFVKIWCDTLHATNFSTINSRVGFEFSRPKDQVLSNHQKKIWNINFYFVRISIWKRQNVFDDFHGNRNNKNTYKLNFECWLEIEMMAGYESTQIFWTIFSFSLSRNSNTH